MNLSSFSLSHLHHLTIRADVYQMQSADCCVSTLAAAVDVLETISSLHRLTLEIVLDLVNETLFKVDFARFLALLESSLTVHHIDLYVYWYGTSDHQKVVDLLADYHVMVDLAKRGVLVLHAQETIPVDPFTTY